MTHIQMKTLFGAMIIAIFTLTSCQSTSRVTHVTGRMIPVDATLDEQPDSSAIALLAPYKTLIDSMMYRKIGYADVTMKRVARESLLSNLVSDVLRQSAAGVIGKPANIGVVNLGGLRNDLTKGDITIGNVFEILPFENSLCVLTVSGDVLNEIFQAMAQKGGAGLSGAKLEISKSGKLLSATVNNAPVEMDRLYTIATIDYVADGNDGLSPMVKASKRICPPNATLRQIFLNYVEVQTAAGKVITSKIEGRITVK